MSQKGGESALSDEEVDVLIEKFRAVKDCGDMASDRLYSGIKAYFAPTVVGVEHIPDEPTLFVGNHCLFGLDGWVVLPVLWHEAGRFVRSLADTAWLAGGFSERMIHNGMIIGHPKVCSAMMQDGEDLLVFPGGAQESMKTAAEKYTLQWRERYGFVRMAAEHGYNITPFGMVGPDDCYDHVMERDDILESPLGKLLTDMGARLDLIPPIPSGLFSSLLPKPQHCYLGFGEPVQVPDFTDKTVPESVLTSVREETAGRIEDLISDMLLLRAQHKQDDGWIRRFLTR